MGHRDKPQIVLLQRNYGVGLNRSFRFFALRFADFGLIALVAPVILPRSPFGCLDLRMFLLQLRTL